jgi:hypothetical protein
MKIVNINGLYHVTVKIHGRVYLAYSPVRSEAIRFLIELITKDYNASTYSK